VFRVDMRLRPLRRQRGRWRCLRCARGVLPDQGRDWERYAMIKARVVSGDRCRRRALLARSAASFHLPALHRLQRDRGAARHEGADQPRSGSAAAWHGNVKLGAGGIREIEFIVPGIPADPRRARDRAAGARLLRVLDAARRAAAGCRRWRSIASSAPMCSCAIPSTRLQAWADQQTQALPEDELAKAAAGLRAWAIPVGAPSALDLERHVESPFQPAVRPGGRRPAAREPGAANVDLTALWQGDPGEEGAAAGPAGRTGFREPGAGLAPDSGAQARSPSYRPCMSPRGRERLDRFMPLLLAAAAATAASVGGDRPHHGADLSRCCAAAPTWCCWRKTRQALEQLVKLCSREPLDRAGAGERTPCCSTS
jgi:glutamate-ammonia-ligase adenylyltransferase